MLSQNINKQKDAQNEVECKEYLVIDEVPSYFNVFKCGRNIFNRLDMTYEWAYMATLKDKYFEKMLETLFNHNDRHNEPLSNKKLQQAVSKVVAETEEEERNPKHNANNVTMDTFWQYPTMTNTQNNIVNVTNERQISSEIPSEMR